MTDRYWNRGPWPPYGWGGYGVGRGVPWGGGPGWWGPPGYGGPGWGDPYAYGYPYPPDYPGMPYNPDDERAWLEARMNDLRTELEEIQKRLDELSGASGE